MKAGQLLFAISLLWILSGCAKQSGDPTIFLPKVLNPFGESSENLRLYYCSTDKVSFRDGFLTEENIRNVFQCANYDGSIEGLRPLFQSGEFNNLLTNINSLLGASSTQSLRESLAPWFEEDQNGQSKIDRLLPLLASIIKNPAFQDALPVLTNILDAGEPTWNILLPNVANLIYTPRFPDNFDDLFLLWKIENSLSKNQSRATTKDYATSLKKIATLLRSSIGEKTVARTLLELLADLQKVQLPATSKIEFLDQMNVKNVFLSMYQESGDLRGETINPRLNADPEPEEIEQGLELTPEARRVLAHRKLYAGGAAAPIVQLANLVEEFHRPHESFLPSIAAWYSANGKKANDVLFDYVANTLIETVVTKVVMEAFLVEFIREKGHERDPSTPIDAPAFVAFLQEAFQSEYLDRWLELQVRKANQEEFGEKNEKALRSSNLLKNSLEIYRLPEVAEFGKSFFPKGKTLPLGNAIKRFSNLHRSDKLQIVFQEKEQSLEAHLKNIWKNSAKDSFGENIVVNFAVQLTQTFFTEYANDFAQNNPNTSLAQWYFSSTYSSPASSEAMASYAFKELKLMESYEKNKDFLKTKFAEEVFSNPNDQRAFRALIDQIPNIWLYIRSGMSRSGNNLTRALSSKDRGYLINNYVNLLASATREGLVAKAAPVISALMEMDPLPTSPENPWQDSLKERRKLSKGSDALKRILNSLFEPAEEDKYETTLLAQILQPMSALVSGEKIIDTEKLLLTSAEQILQTPDQKINDFFAQMNEADLSNDPRKNRAYFESIAELLKKDSFPDVLRQVNRLFKDEAVKPALDYFAKKVDDGTLDRILLFVRRVLGFRGSR